MEVGKLLCYIYFYLFDLILKYTLISFDLDDVPALVSFDLGDVPGLEEIWTR